MGTTEGVKSGRDATAAQTSGTFIAMLTGLERDDRIQPNNGSAPALFAGFLGWTLDAFDYFLVVFCLTDIGREFGKTDKQMSIALLLTLAFRPVGAFIFGLLADRYGRRLPLMLDLVFYSIVEVMTGLRTTTRSSWCSGAIRHRHGRGMGRRRIAGDGKGSAAMARRPLRASTGGICGGESAGGIGVSLLFPHLGWPCSFSSGDCRRCWPSTCDSACGSRRCGNGGAKRLEIAGHQHPLPLAALRLSRAAHDDDESFIARNAGYVPDTPQMRHWQFYAQRAGDVAAFTMVVQFSAVSSLDWHPIESAGAMPC